MYSIQDEVINQNNYNRQTKHTRTETDPMVPPQDSYELTAPVPFGYQNTAPYNNMSSASSIPNPGPPNPMGYRDNLYPNGQDTVSYHSASATSSHSNPGSSNPMGYDNDFYRDEENAVPSFWDTVQYRNSMRPNSTVPLGCANSTQRTVPSHQVGFIQKPKPSGTSQPSQYDIDHTGIQDPTMPFPTQYDYTVPSNHMEAQDQTALFPVTSESASMDSSTVFSPDMLPPNHVQYQVRSSTTESVNSASPSMDFATTPYPDTSKASTDTTTRVCSNCFTTDTYEWRCVTSKTRILCATCDNYQRKYKKPRPPMPRPKSELPKICTRCSKTESCRWFLDRSKTALICRPCHRQEREYGTDRPLIKRPNIEEFEKMCSKCLITESSSWHFDLPNTDLICGSCYNNESKHGTDRPPITRSTIANFEKVCSSCSKTESRKWHYDLSKTGLFCFSCYYYELKHGAGRRLTKRVTIADMAKICTQCSKTETSRWILNKTKTGVVCYPCHARQLRMEKQQKGTD